MTPERLYWIAAYATVGLYVAMALCAALARRPREAATAALFALANALIFWR